MTSRVQQLEQVLEKLKSQNQGDGSAVDNETVSGTIGTPARPESAQNVEAKKHLDRSAARLVFKEGKSKYIRNNFWATINDEVSVSLNDK